MKKKKINQIKNFIILGGSLTSLEFCKFLQIKKVNHELFFNKRQSKEKFKNCFFIDLVKKDKVKYTITNNINRCKNFKKYNPYNSIIIGFGQPWKLENKILKAFENKSFDVMGIPMPEYRGGAHYSWMIINQNYRGGIFIQDISKKTIQGKIDTNRFIDGIYYNYPNKLKIPQDFFDYSSKKEIVFLKKFYNKIKNNFNFKFKKFSCHKSLFFPRLLSSKNSFIDWNFPDSDLINFINAFDDPYPGAQTFLSDTKVHLKKIKIFKNKHFGSFSKGLIINKDKNLIYISLKNKIITTGIILNQKKENIFKKIKVGERFFTPKKFLEISMGFMRKDL